MEDRPAVAASGATAAESAGPGDERDYLPRLLGPLLRALAEIGGFDATYVTAIDWVHRQQEVTHVFNTGDVEVPAGTRIDCPDHLSEQTFSGVTRSNELPTEQPDSEVARSLGLASYASVPIIATDHRLFGTLCGASRNRGLVADTTITAMESFARLIVEQMARDDIHRAERRAGLAERQLTDRAKFLAEAEHQLKTPLIALTGFADALTRSGATMSEEHRSEVATVIHRNAWRLSDQIDRLLEESLAEVRGRDLHPMVIDLRDSVAAAMRGFEESAADHRLRLVAGDDVRVLADDEALYQLLAHLLDNAIKYSAGGTDIVVSVRHAGAFAEIDVRDDGIGVPTDIDVFAAFQRGHDPTTAARPAVGLGLHIVRNLATAMGGTITAARNPDHGSTFTVHLPCPPATPTTQSTRR